jgi:hypothetical protein
MPITQPVSSFVPSRGQRVFFGRRHGEQTLGEVIKVNRASVKVKQLEARGVLKDHRVGTVWTVARSLVSPAPEGIKISDGEVVSSGVPRHMEVPSNLDGEAMARQLMLAEIERLKLENAALKAKRAPQVKRPDAEIMRDILGVYNELSPENLTCDGELSQSRVRARYRALQAQLGRLQRELGRTVTETEAYASARG